MKFSSKHYFPFSESSPALSTDMSIFSFNIQDLSENNTPMLTPVLTPRLSFHFISHKGGKSMKNIGYSFNCRSSLSRSLLNFSFKSISNRPISPLVTGTGNSSDERKDQESYESRKHNRGIKCFAIFT